VEVVTAPPTLSFYGISETCTPVASGSMVCDGVVWDSTTTIHFTETEVANRVTLTRSSPNREIAIALLVSVAVVILCVGVFLLCRRRRSARVAPGKIAY
jgi:hypothetical protein